MALGGPVRATSGPAGATDGPSSFDALLVSGAGPLGAGLSVEAPAPGAGASGECFCLREAYFWETRSLLIHAPCYRAFPKGTRRSASGSRMGGSTSDAQRPPQTYPAQPRPPTMSQPEYIAALLSIIVGLGLTDLAQSLRELVRPQRTVNWHWLPLLWAATAFLIAVQFWWNSFPFLKEATSAFFLPYLVAFLLLYLTCAFALPDPEWQRPGAEAGGGFSVESLGARAPLDLRAFHFSVSHRRWFFGVFIAFILTSQTSSQIASLFAERSVNPQEIPGNLVLVALLGTLVWTGRTWAHAVISVLCFLGIGWATLATILGWTQFGELLGL